MPSGKDVLEPCLEWFGAFHKCRKGLRQLEMDRRGKRIGQVAHRPCCVSDMQDHDDTYLGFEGVAKWNVTMSMSKHQEDCIHCFAMTLIRHCCGFA